MLEVRTYLMSELCIFIIVFAKSRGYSDLGKSLEYNTSKLFSIKMRLI